MTRLFSLKKIAFAAVAAAGLSFAAGSADAGYYGYGYGYNHYHLKKVVTYDYQYVNDYYYVTRYDHCGVPYQAKVLYTKKIAIPVVSYVKVYH